MKKLIALLVVFMAMISAQLSAGTIWDFAGKGFSDATIANLAADNTNWTAQNSPVNRYVNATTMSGELKANGLVIPETAGLIFGSLSAKKVNVDFGYVPPRIMLNGTNLTFTLKALKAGQKITIVTMTANTNNARGISCTTGNVTRLAGEETSLDVNTNVFQVNANVEGETDVTFTTGSTGGIHIRYIGFDGNSEVNPDAPINIAYVYDSTYAEGKTVVGTENDPIFQYGLMQKNVTLFNVAKLTNDTTAVFADSLAALEKYDVVVVSDAMSADHPFGKKLAYLINRVPMLNMKSFLYNTWKLGTGINPTNVGNGEQGIASVKVDSAFAKQALFTDIDVSEGLKLFTGTVTDKNLVQAYSAQAGSLFASDSIIASIQTDKDTFDVIHKHGTSNTYLLIPMCSDAQATASESAIQLIYNAAVYLASTKAAVIPATKPTISLNYKDGSTVVTLSTITAGASVYYTTDGTVPTASSLLYSGPLTFTDTCTVKAIAIKQGYDNSSIATAAVLIKQQLAVPSISLTATESGKTVTITGAEGATVYYTTNGGTPVVAKAVKYTEPFTLTRPCTVKAMAVQDGKLNSDIASEKITIDGYKERAKTLVWANFN
ncbi:MAG: chitobiase/beta-hexosaminidase C-terminal domain-containing protein, partial [Bacteroidota bacterium]|nr:chitobiase/beta-hexosaminidase C-terminal domain-containing protein [Bacteroidota bacterium]